MSWCDIYATHPETFVLHVDHLRRTRTFAAGSVLTLTQSATAPVSNLQDHLASMLKIDSNPNTHALDGTA